jgi:hypothetical protein
MAESYAIKTVTLSHWFNSALLSVERLDSILCRQPVGFRLLVAPRALLTGLVLVNFMESKATLLELLLHLLDRRVEATLVRAREAGIAIHDDAVSLTICMLLVASDCVANLLVSALLHLVYIEVQLAELSEAVNPLDDLVPKQGYRVDNSSFNRCGDGCCLGWDVFGMEDEILDALWSVFRSGDLRSHFFHFADTESMPSIVMKAFGAPFHLLKLFGFWASCSGNHTTHAHGTHTAHKHRERQQCTQAMRSPMH